MKPNPFSRRDFLAAPAALSLAATGGRPARTWSTSSCTATGPLSAAIPRQCGIFNFGRGEIAVLHNHALCGYQKLTDIQHDFGGYHSRSTLLLQRSTDGGRTWPGEDEVEVWNEAAPVEDRRRFCCRHLLRLANRSIFLQPESIVTFPRTFLGPIKYGALRNDRLRSPVKG